MIYMFLSNNPSSGDINSSNLSCFYLNFANMILYLFYVLQQCDLSRYEPNFVVVRLLF